MRKPYKHQIYLFNFIKQRMQLIVPKPYMKPDTSFKIKAIFPNLFVTYPQQEFDIQSKFTFTKTFYKWLAQLLVLKWLGLKPKYLMYQLISKEKNYFEMGIHAAQNMLRIWKVGKDYTELIRCIDFRDHTALDFNSV